MKAKDPDNIFPNTRNYKRLRFNEHVLRYNQIEIFVNTLFQMKKGILIFIKSISSFAIFLVLALLLKSLFKF